MDGFPFPCLGPLATRGNGTDTAVERRVRDPLKAGTALGAETPRRGTTKDDGHGGGSGAAGSYWDQFRRPGGLGGCWELLVRRYDGNVQNMIKAPLSEGRRGRSLRETPPSSMWRSNYA